MDAEVKTQLAAANARYHEGRFVEAEQMFLRLHALDPDNTAVLMRLGELALWQNQTSRAEDYFKATLAHTSWLGRQWLFGTQLYSLLALTYYRQDRFQEAAQFYRQAAGPVVLGPFRDLKALATQLDLFDGRTPYQIEGANRAEIAFLLTDPLPVIPVSVNGGEPVPFFIDTGGAEVIIDTKYAQEVGAIRAGSLSGEGGGTKGVIELGKVESVAIGDITVRHVPVHLMDTQQFAAVFDGLPVKGIIGTRLLMHFLATIDYPNACLILHSPAAQLDLSGAKVIPFWLIQTHYIVTEGSLNEKTARLFFVDTGLAGNGFSASEDMLREADIAVDWTKSGVGVAGFGASEVVDVTAERLTLGSGSSEIIAQNLPGVVFKKPFAVLGNTLGFRIDGLVSHQFFRPYALTLDFVGMRLIVCSRA